MLRSPLLGLLLATLAGPALAHISADPAQAAAGASQARGDDVAQWSEIPDSGEAAVTMAHPAPSLLVTPAQGAAETHHH